MNTMVILFARWARLEVDPIHYLATTRTWNVTQARRAYTDRGRGWRALMRQHLTGARAASAVLRQYRAHPLPRRGL
jgi:hypothetical protein